MRRLLRWILGSLIAVVALVVIAVVVLLVSLDRPAVRGWTRGQLTQLLGSALGAEVSIGAVAKLGLGGITLEDVAIRDRGQTILEAQSLELGLSIASLVPITSPRIAVDAVIHEPRLHLVGKQA